MPKLAIAGTIEITPGRRAELLPLLAALRIRSLQEPGTVEFALLLPRDDDSRVFLHEVYSDDAAFDTHRGGAALAAFREKTAGMVAKLTFTKCTLLEETV